MKPIKLFIEAYAISEPHISGIGHMTLELIKALEKHPDNQKKFKIVLVINKDREETLIRWGFNTVQVKIIPVLPTRLFNIIWKFDLLPPMDLWIGRGVYIFPNYKNWRLVFSRSLTYICDVSYLLYPQYVSPKNQRFLERNIHKWTKRADKVLAISKNARQEVITNLKLEAKKLLLVPCGVDTTVFYKRPLSEIEHLKTDCGINKEYILYLGNIEPRKNITRLVKAYMQLAIELRTRYSLVLVGGTGWLNEPIMELIAAAQAEGYDIIRPTYYVPDDKLPALHSGATILIHPALYEGFGISVLQAMACETPVVVAHNSSLPEVAGDAALFVDAQSEQDIANKMARLLTDKQLRRRLSASGLRQVKKYSWNETANILVNELIQ